jgi:hypothetical protein
MKAEFDREQARLDRWGLSPSSTSLVTKAKIVRSTHPRPRLMRVECIITIACVNA